MARLNDTQRKAWDKARKLVAQEGWDPDTKTGWERVTEIAEGLLQGAGEEAVQEAEGLLTDQGGYHTDLPAQREDSELFKRIRTVIAAPTKPMEVAEKLLENKRYEDIYTFRHWRDQWMSWTGTHWVEVDAGTVSAEVGQALRHAKYESGSGDEKRTMPWDVTPRKVEAVLGAMRLLTHLAPGTTAPGWIGAAKPLHITFIPCRNGIVQVDTKTGERKLIPPTPRFFTTWSVPMDYNPKAPKPVTFLGFMDSSFPGDPQSIDLWQEWFGYNISGDLRQQKIMLAIGARRSGKGTLTDVLKLLMGGSENVASPTLMSLSGRFGLDSLMGASSAIIGDARLPRNGHAVIAERLLTISGMGALDVERKHKNTLRAILLPTRFTVLSNVVPVIEDDSAVIASRYLVTNFTQSFEGREDRDLGKKLELELAGILNWALDGIDLLRERGRFTEPESSQHLLDTLKDGSSPFRSFVNENCSYGARMSVPVDDLYRRWVEFCEANNIDKPGSKTALTQGLQALDSRIKRKQVWPSGHRTRKISIYEGIGLQSEGPETLPED